MACECTNDYCNKTGPCFVLPLGGGVGEEKGYGLEIDVASAICHAKCRKCPRGPAWWSLACSGTPTGSCSRTPIRSAATWCPSAPGTRPLPALGEGKWLMLVGGGKPQRYHQLHSIVVSIRKSLVDASSTLAAH